MAERTTARDVMSTAFLRLPGDTPLRRVMGLLTRGGSAPRAIVVEGGGGEVLGVVTARLLLRALFRGGVPERSPDEERSAEDRLLDQARDRVDAPIRELVSHVPLAAPGDPLVRLLRITKDDTVECLLVVEGGRVAGIVWLSDVFRAAAALALTPEVAPGPGER